MVELNELVSLAAGGSYLPCGTEQTLLVSGATEGDEVVVAIASCFGTHEEMPAVRLVVGGSVAGYLQREDLYAFVGSIDRGEFGSSDGSFLPGVEPPRLRPARCPADGAEFLVSRFDPGDLPRCPDHDEALELAE